MGFRCVPCFLSGPFRRVGWFRRSVCSPPPPALFWSLARRLCPLFSSSCLSGLTRLRPGVCVCNIWIDVKLLSFFLLSSPFFNNAGGWGSLGVPHLTKTAPSGRDISARPALTYLHLYILYAVGLYVKDSCGFYWGARYTLNAVGLYVNDSCDLYWRGKGLSQEPQQTIK